MNPAILSIFLDILVLVFLGVTIYYAIRLTESLNAFRRTRQDFDGIMRTLTRNIEEAQRGVESLKNVAKDSGQSLQKTINDSRKMAVELESINQISANLAGRLENLAGNSLVGVLDDPEAFELPDNDEGGGFAIFDRDYSEKKPSAEKTPETPANFQSQAERDLYDALQRNRKTGRGT